MRKSKLALLAGALLTIFTLFSCQQPETPSTNTVTVKFDDNGTIIRTLTVKAGATISTSSKPSNPSKNNNYFMYWSASKASQAAATEFDFSKTAITKDTTLYAIYSPKLTYNSIQNLASTQVTIKLATKNVFPLEDGSYAGIKFQRSTNDSTYQDYAVNTPPTATDDSSNRYLTYTFSTPLPAGINWIKVSNYNNKETSKQSIEVFQNPKLIVFYDCGQLYHYCEVESGSVIPSTKMPTNTPSQQFNYFMYWSKSKASKATALEFDFNTPITEDTVLYAIYTPRLEDINAVTATQIEIKFYRNAVFPLDDGSYAGLKVQYSANDVTYQDININIPDNYRDEGVYRYVNYSFPSTFAFNSSVRQHYFKAVNGKQTDIKTTKSLSTAAAATNLAVTTGDSYAKLTFKTACAGWSYKVQLLKAGNLVASKTIVVYGSNTTGFVEFFGLTNGTEYTFNVITDGSSYSEHTTATPSIPETKKSSDWLVLMYMDGDNNLHHSLYIDMNEAEYGLKQIRYSDGITATSDYDSVNAVVLWDGATSWGSGEYDDEGNELQETPIIGESGTYLLELGADNMTSYNLADAAYSLSPKTKNLSYTADWICSNVTESVNQNNYHGEVNMGNKATLINFLNWAQAHYTANKGIILQFSNHGGGPRSIIYAEDDNGRTYKIGDVNQRKALCWDDSAGSNQFLKTKDVSEALTTAGFTGTNKLSMIVMDVCLGSSIEDAYQFRNNADYLAASPNTIPGNGLNYTSFMKGFTKDTTSENFGKQLVIDYKEQYTASNTRNSLWNNYAQQAYGANNYSSLEDNQKSNLEWRGDLGITTFTLTDLSKVADVKTAVDNMCNILLSTKGKAKTIYVDADGDISPTATEKTQNYVKYIGNNHASILTSYINWQLYYQGSFTWLYDIGYFADMVKMVSAPTYNGKTNANAWSELNTAAGNVIAALNTAIKYSWRDSKLDSNSDFYHKLDNSTTAYIHHYGLTIAGYGLAANAGKLVKGSRPDWYTTDLAFGADSKWGDLLAYWFN